MRLTVLTENTANRRGMLAEHGFSVLVEACGKRILFDTGQSDVFWKNARAMGISLENLDAVAFSHGHYDHCGGLKSLIGEGPLPPVWFGKGALERKLCEEKDGSLRDIGIPWLPEDRASFRENGGLAEIFAGVFLAAGIPKLADFEGVPLLFVRSSDGKLLHDEMQDEQLLCVVEGDRLHVVAGCCHMGAVSCLRHAVSLFSGKKLGMVLAGMHLRGASAARIDATIRAIEELDPDCLVPVHCTGIMAIAQMKLALKDRCKLAEAGKVLETDGGKHH